MRIPGYRDGARPAADRRSSPKLAMASRAAVAHSISATPNPGSTYQMADGAPNTPAAITVTIPIAHNPRR